MKEQIAIKCFRKRDQFDVPLGQNQENVLCSISSFPFSILKKGSMGNFSLQIEF